MRSVAFIVIALAILTAIAAVWLSHRKNSQEESVQDGEHKDDARKSVGVELNGQRFEIVPSSVSEGRVVKTGLPSKGSEDMTHLLRPPSHAMKPRRHGEERDYRPDDKIDWVVDIAFDGAPVLRRSRILELLDKPWLTQNGQPEIYGWSPEDRHWTFLRAGGVSETYTKLAFAWHLFDPLSKKDFSIKAADLLRYKTSLSERLRQLGKASCQENRTADDAERIGKDILTLVSRCNREIAVILTAPEGKSYSGQDIWDVMLCLGLQWGDMDLFHWRNESEIGGDVFFSVWTSTPPGYFLPEEIAAGRTRVRDLVFGFSVPRSCDPVAIYSSMMQVVKYSQGRLGGKITDGAGMPLNEKAALEEIRNIIEQMKKTGFAPGEGSTLRVF